MKHDAIECSMCEKWSHRVCASLSKIKLKHFSNDNINWNCNNCKSLFPFSNMSDGEFVFEMLKINIHI